MKALLVIDNDVTAKEYNDMLTLKNCACIRYCQPLKAMDNLEEIEPEIIFISSIDFPRHWKPFIQYAQTTLPDDVAIFLIANNFSDDEEKKAKHLHVKKVIHNDSPLEDREKIIHDLLMKFLFSDSDDENEDEPLFTKNTLAKPDKSVIINSKVIEEPRSDNLIDKNEDIQESSVFETKEDAKDDSEKLNESLELNESTGIDEQKSEENSVPEFNFDEMEELWTRKNKEQFMFIHPITDVIVTGVVTTTKEHGFIFEPDWEDETSDLQAETTVRLCSLYTSDLVCKKPTVQIIKNNISQIEFMYKSV